MNFGRLRSRCVNHPIAVFVIILFMASASAAATTNAPEKFTSADCLDCHTDPANKRIVNGQAEPMALFPTNGFAKSVHSQLDCIDCHDGITELQHDPNVPPP